MKLLFACANSASDPHLWSGTVWNCRRALESAGVELEVIDQIPFECPPPLRILHQFYKGLTRKTHSLQSEPAVLQRAALRIATRFARSDCQAVFSPGSGVAVHAYLPAEIPAFPYLDATKLSWIRTYFGEDTLTTRSRRHIDAVDRISLKNATKTFFSSQWALDEAVRDYGAPAGRMAVVPFGANLVEPPARAEVEAWIQARSREALRLLFLGREWERKGGTEALALGRELRRRGIKVVLHIVGCTPQIDEADRPLVELHGFINRHGPEGWKKFRALLAESHVLVFLSRAEAYGIALCEAAAFGVPMLAADTGGIPTIVRPGVNGWLAPLPFSVSEGASALQTTFAHPEVYQRLAHGARLDYENRLNWSAAASALVQHMQAALTRPPSDALVH
jgi:glycosyltransferase involved in cell wall biosynthesis